MLTYTANGIRFTLDYSGFAPAAPKAVRCRKCQRSIAGEFKTDSTGRPFHPYCFRSQYKRVGTIATCAACHDGVRESSAVLDEQGRVIHRGCDTRGLPRCQRCKAKVKYPVIRDGKKWHPSCWGFARGGGA